MLKQTELSSGRYHMAVGSRSRALLGGQCKKQWTEDSIDDMHLLMHNYETNDH